MLSILITHIHTKGHKETFRDEGYIYYVGSGNSNRSVIHMSKLTKLHILIICSFLYTNYISIKLEKNFFKL